MLLLKYVISNFKRKIRYSRFDPFFARLTWKGLLPAAIAIIYAVLNIFYDYNIHWLSIFDLPFGRFYREEVLPFIAKPVNWMGFSFNNIYLSLAGLSAVGASVWANAEFQAQSYIFLHPFPKLQYRPGQFEPDLNKVFRDMEERQRKNPNRLISFRRFMIFIQILFLTWTLLGILAIFAGLWKGIQTFISFFSFLFLTIRAGYYLDKYPRHKSVSEDGIKKDTEESIKFEMIYLKLDAEVDKRLDRLDVIPISEFNTIKPVVRRTVTQMGRIIALSLVLMLLLVIIRLCFLIW